MKIHLLHICTIQEPDDPPPPPSSGTDEKNYYALAVEDGDRHYYWAKGASLRISKGEFERVCGNPRLYYFSTALKLHLKIRRALQFWIKQTSQSQQPGTQ